MTPAYPVPLTNNKEEKIKALITELDASIFRWDQVYPEILHEAEVTGMKMTEEKLRIATRNEMRVRGVEIPEIVRWRLRAALGGIESHD